MRLKLLENAQFSVPKIKHASNRLVGVFRVFGGLWGNIRRKIIENRNCKFFGRFFSRIVSREVKSKIKNAAQSFSAFPQSTTNERSFITL